MIYRKITGHKYRTRHYFTFDTKMCPNVYVMSPGGWVYLSNGELYIKAGYSWNGASGGMWDSENVIVASLVHDALYQLLREGVLSQRFRPDADLVFRNICVEKGMSAFRAGYAYRLLRMFGEKAAQANPRDRGAWLTAP